ncbi:ABC transporter permease [candidate division KSB1 bacterium]
MVKDPKDLKLPKTGLYILKKILSYGYSGNIIGDFEEEFKTYSTQNGRVKTLLWFWGHILISLPALINNTMLWRSAMLRNYLKSAVRSFIRNKLNSIINLTGLSVGIASCILIFLFIRNEITYDTFHDDPENIYMITRKAEGQWGSKLFANLPLPLGPELIKDYPEVEYGFRLLNSTTTVKKNTEENSEDIYYADPEILNVFKFEMLSGGGDNSLDSPNKILISRRLCEKYFGGIDKQGESILLKVSGEYEPYIITGVFDDFPENSSVKPGIILPFETARRQIGEEMFNDWQRYTPVLIIKLAQGTFVGDLQNKFPDIIEKYDLNKSLTVLGVGELSGTLVPVNISEFHLNSLIVDEGNLEPQSSSVYSFIIGGLGLLIIAIACINFMNLSISQSMKRAKEVGIRKVIGAYRKQLINQFYIETFLMTITALVSGLIIAWFLLPLFNSLAGKNLVLDFRGDISTILIFVIMIFLVGILSGSYPAFFLSKFNPVAAFREDRKLGGSSYLTRSLIIIQFTLSVVLIIGAINMTRQLDYIQSKDLGYDKENVVVLNTRNNILNTLKQELVSSTNIRGIAGASAGIYRNFVGMTAFRDAGKDAFVVYQKFNTDHDFLETVGLKLQSGRYFSIDHPSDVNDAVVINEAMAKLHGLNDPVGKRLRISYDKESEVIGVVKDFHYKSLHSDIQPLLITLITERPANRIYVKINADNIDGSIEEIENAWNKVNPQETFNYTFIDESLNLLYTEDAKWSRIISYSMIFAIFIACLGLYGMASLIAVSRTKEFGIRKVLGASVTKLLSSFNLEFLLLILIANAVAWPICYSAVNKWLENFAYRIEVEVSAFILGAIISLVITLSAVSIQALKASLANPVKCLRSE